MAASSTGDPDNDPAVPPSVRVQILATEHWGLLASRTTAQSEVLTRITIFLTLVSAGLVSLALMGQVMDFSASFGVLAIAVLAVILIIGILTQVRVFNVGLEDLMYVLAMNRLRGAYVALDPGVAPFLMASTHDDREGSLRTYFFLGRRHAASQFFGSTMALICLVNGTLVGALVAAPVGVLLAPLAVAISSGVVAGLAYTGVSMALGQRQFLRSWNDYVPVFPS